MADDFFRIHRGLQLDSSSLFLTGSGDPASTTDTQNASVGSYYTDTSNGNLWLKITSGTALSDWSQMATQTYVDNQSATGISWREPAVVRDNVSTTVPTGTAGNPITVDGVSVTNAQRVLFSNATPTPNIFVYNQTTGLFVEDVNTLSTGDAVYIEHGTSAGQTYVYNGTVWVLINQSSSDEIGFIDTFIGKTVGNVTPTYSTTNFVANADSLRVAIGKLDTEFGVNVTTGNYILSTNKVNANIQALDTKLGAAVTSTNFISNGNSITANLSALDAEFGANVSNGTVILAANKVNGNITALDTELGYVEAFIGKSVGNNTPSYTSQVYVTNGDNLEVAVGKLDAALNDVSAKTSAANVTTDTVLDTVTAAKMVEWDIYVVNSADATNVSASKIFAVSNGTDTDFTRFATLHVGAVISGLTFNVVISGGGAMELHVASTTAVDVIARRVTSV